MDKIFFGESGLTCTSANHIANLAKERIADLESWLASISFTNTTISLIGSSEKEFFLVTGSFAQSYNISTSSFFTVLKLIPIIYASQYE